MGQEVKTVGLMIDLYCRGQHGSKDDLCPECRELFEYVKRRLTKCPLKETAKVRGGDQFQNVELFSKTGT
jgi:hypothetical protein